jgi:hypothetical protein
MTDCFIDPFGFDNMLTIWPTKLTMTPFASNVALRFIRPSVPEPSGVWPNVERPIRGGSPEVAQEMWARDEFSAAHEAKTPWLPYDEFLDRWHAPAAA